MIYLLIQMYNEIPKKGQLYINKLGKLQICKDYNYSRRAKKRTILQPFKFTDTRIEKAIIRKLNER